MYLHKNEQNLQKMMSEIKLISISGILRGIGESSPIPRSFKLSPSPPRPRTFRKVYPRPRPRNLGIFGVYPRKIPEISALPVPAPSPKIFKTCPRPHPVPELRGNPRGPPGIGGRLPLTTSVVLD